MMSRFESPFDLALTVNTPRIINLVVYGFSEELFDRIAQVPVETSYKDYGVYREDGVSIDRFGFG